MDYFRCAHIVRTILEAIAKENTGQAIPFAQSLGICRSTLYNIFNTLKSYDVQIRFSRTKQSFVFTKPVDINKILHTISSLPDPDCKKESES